MTDNNDKEEKMISLENCPEIMNAEEVARIFHISLRTVYALTKSGDINSERQANICLATISESFNNRMASRKVRGYWQLTDEELERFGFNPKSNSDETL